MEKAAKEHEALKRNIAGLLKDFERNKQWADIGNWLYRLQQNLGDKKAKQLPYHTNLAKRLAQCLNPNLPAGIHITALKIYTIILQNFSDRFTLIPLMSIGLFPFFQHSSFQLKNDLLKIYQEFFTVDHESLQMIISLMNALLTGLNEKSEDLAKKIYALCDKISKINGRTWVDGAVWVNILRSPKVRIAGFKYFMKVFKDRDRLKLNEEKEGGEIRSYENLKGLESPKNKMESIKQIQIVQYKVIESQMYENLKEVLNMPDNFQSRFPNFSSLVVNALLVCLEQNDNLVKRAAMDLMINYLKVNNNNNRDFISTRDLQILVEAMLQILKLKQFSLTHRMYKYLFDQPNMEGFYNIDAQSNAYELQVLQSAIFNILNKSSSNHNHDASDNNLIIIETIITDHPILSKLLLPNISFTIIQYLHKVAKTKDWKDKINEFYKVVIVPHKETFVNSIVKDLTEFTEEAKVRNIISHLDYYFDHIEKVYGHRENKKGSLHSNHSNSNSVLNEQEIKTNQITMQIIQHILQYLSKSQLKYEQASIDAVELCNKLYNDIKQSTPFSKEYVEVLDNLINSHPNNTIYGTLLTLHPKPKKEFLLPHIHEGFLGTICLNNLMMLEIESQSELKDIFFAIFKLLNCHLWEDRGIQYIKIYSKKYPLQFQKHINSVEPSEWLIYWRKMNGDVEDGVIRMLTNLNHQSPLESNLSKKWIQSSQHIVSKVIDPIYAYMRKHGLESTVSVYTMLRSVFTTLKEDFTKFFFLQRERYLLPIVEHIFSCLDGSNQDLKSQSISMMEFILLKTNTSDEKIQFITLTLAKTLSILQLAIKAHQFLEQIELLSYLRTLINTFNDLQKTSEKRDKVVKLVQSSNLFTIVVGGMYECQKPYVRTLYIQYLHDTCTILGNVDSNEKVVTSHLINIVLDKLFIKLKQNDITNLQQIIKGKEVKEINKRKRSQSINLIVEKQIPSKVVLNVQSTYAQVIELWNSVKFFTRFSIKSQIKQLPINHLISIILESFPFSDLHYIQFNPSTTTKQYDLLQQEVRNVTGLKKQVLEIFAIIWQKYECQIIDFLIDKGDPRVLVHAGIDPNLIIKAISRSSIMKTIKNYIRITKLSLPKGTLHYNLPTLLMENQLVYFLYLYLTYCNLTLVKSKKLGYFLQVTLSLLKTIKISPHIETKLWLFEIIYLLSERIPMKQVNTDNAKLKPQLHELLKQIQSQIVMSGIRGRSFTHRAQIKTGIFTIFSKEQKQQFFYDFVQKFPPTLHTITTKNSSLPLGSAILEVQNYTEHVLTSNCQNQTEQNFINYLSIVCIKTMIAISNQTFTNLYQNDASKISLIIQQILIQFLPICKDKSDANQVYLQLIAQYLHKVLDSPIIRPQIMRSMRAKIIEIYMGNDFFKCTKKTLYHWKQIIDYCTQKQDLLAQLLCKEGLFDGIFTKKAQSMRLKIKSFERVCFVIYAGKIDKYENKLWNVLQSLNEVMKQQDPSPALLILILFCIRILFLRLSQSSLSRMFRSIWPGLMTLLVQIFRKDKAKKNVNLLLAGLKVIELVNALQIQQFHLHQWMFVFDYFGLRLSNLPQNNPDILTPFTFKPYLAHLLPHHSFKCTFLPQKMDSKLPSQPLPRRLVVKQSSIDSQQQLRNHAYVLMQYIIDLNQLRSTVSKQEIENLIEGDFISLDDYIFQIK